MRDRGASILNVMHVGRALPADVLSAREVHLVRKGLPLEVRAIGKIWRNVTHFFLLTDIFFSSSRNSTEKSEISILLRQTPAAIPTRNPTTPDFAMRNPATAPKAMYREER